MFATCWFISFVFIFIYIYFGYSPKRTHMFPWNLSKIIKAFEEKMTNLNKEITTRSKTLEEACFKCSCFLGCLGGHHNKSHQQCVFVVLSKANHSILVQEKSSCDNRLSMYGIIGMSDLSDPKTSCCICSSDIGDISYWKMYVYLTLSCIQVICALLSL